jgi:outer membrane receptor protein involved in Fe transport
VIVLLLILAGLCGDALAQAGAGIEVRCTPATAAATLWPGNQTQRTDAGGRVSFDGLAAGRYRLEICAAGFAAQDTTLQLAHGEQVSLLITLEPLAVTLPEITVESARNRESHRSFSRREIEASAARSLPDFLRDAAGLELRSDGAAGGAQTLRIGGSQPEHVLVLVDGRRLQNVGSGEADLSAVPLDWVESVEVTRGGSAEFGGEAIGGILRITTRQGEQSDLAADVDYRPTCTRATCLRSDYFGSVFTFLSLTRTQGPGDFKYTITEDDGTGPFTVNLGSSFRRANADVTRDQLLAKIRAPLRGAGVVEISGALDRANRGMPGYLAPQLTPLARQNTRQEAFNARLLRDRKSFFLEARGSYQRDRRQYADPDPLALIKQSGESSDQWDIESRASFVRGKSVLSGGAQAGRETLFSESIAHSRAARIRTAAWTRLRWSALSDRSAHLSLAACPALRWEQFDNEQVLLPSATLALELTRQVRMGAEATWGRSYHAPSLYSLFWLDDQVAQGNPDLHPELSQEITGRLHAQSLSANPGRAELGVSDQRVEDLIVWRRTFDNRWKPFNLKRAHIRTLDLSAEQALWKEHVKVSGGANWTEARDATDDRNTGGKYLTFRAPRSQRLGVELRVRGFDLLARMRWVSARPVLETNSKWLQAYRILDLQLSYALRIKSAQIEPAIGVDNALDEDYRLIRFAPMPKREWFIAVRIVQV